jgi:hypothetical protein
MNNNNNNNNMRMSGHLHTPAVLTSAKKPPTPIGFENAWTANPVWKLWRREKFRFPVENRTISSNDYSAMPEN